MLGSPDDLRAGAEPLAGPTTELGVDAVPRARRVAGRGQHRRARRGRRQAAQHLGALIGPDGERARRATARSTCSTSRWTAWSTASPTSRRPGRRSWSPTSTGCELGLAVCYDLRFPELFRILAVRGARAFSLPAAFTVPTGRAHWEVLVRARAIENQAFVTGGRAVRHSSAASKESYGHSMIVDPWGRVLGARRTSSSMSSSPTSTSTRRTRSAQKLPALANRRPGAYRWPEPAGALHS